MFRNAHKIKWMISVFAIIQFLLIFLLSLPLIATAEIYQWQDTKGKLHFSDRPKQGAKTLAIKPGYGYYRVKKVLDGDTIKLENGRKVRLLAINAPEVAGRNKLEEQGGEAAKQWLIKKLQGKKVRLEYDQEKKDKYGRTLAHVFTDKDEHINLMLLRLGLAHLNLYPSNTLYLKQLTVAQQQAEQQTKGIWSLDNFQVKPIDQIDKNNYRGWQRLTGQAKKIKQTRKYFYLQFSDKFSARISKANRHLFPAIKSYLKQPLEIRGWVHRNKEHFVMQVRHPSQIKPYVPGH